MESPCNILPVFRFERRVYKMISLPILLPLDQKYPANRLEFMVKDSGASAVIVNEMAAQQFAFDGPKLVHVDKLRGEAAYDGDIWVPPSVADYIVASQIYVEL